MAQIKTFVPSNEKLTHQLGTKKANASKTLNLTFLSLFQQKKKKEKINPPSHGPCQSPQPLPTPDAAGGWAAAPPPVSSTSLSPAFGVGLSL